MVRFGQRVFLMQLLAAATVILVCLGAFGVVTVKQLRTEAEVTGLAIARTVATDEQVREETAAFSGVTDFTGQDLASGALQETAAGIVSRSDVLFVVIANDQGRRLAHPTPERLGEELSTPYADVLAGNEVLAWEQGTLGETLRAKVPIYAPDGDGARVVGEVSVGIPPSSAFADLPLLASVAAAIAAAALLVAAAAALLIRRWLERLTRGVQPEEIAGLLQSRAAILDGVGEAVLVLDREGAVRAANAAVPRLLGVSAPVGEKLTPERLDPALSDMIARVMAGESPVTDEPVIDGNVVYAVARDVRHGDEDLGIVIVALDRTDMIALSERLETVRAATNAQRAQRHEFANRLHVVGGLIAAGRPAEAQRLIGEFADRGALPEEGVFAVGDEFLRSFLATKAIEASERGVELRLSANSAVTGTIAEPEDVAVVLGNLIDNAVTAAVEGVEPRWVEVDVLSVDRVLALAVADSGRGVSDLSSLFRGRAERDGDDTNRVHGRGIGLTLARRFAQRTGGDLWLADAGGLTGGAVFAAELPDAINTEKEGAKR